MTPEERVAHWERVHATRSPTDVSWYQAIPDRSLAWIEECQLPGDAPLLDVGGGASLLVDHCLTRGYTDLTVLDISPAALAVSRARLGEGATSVDWVVADVTTFQPPRRYALWHDRAVFHFLIDPLLRSRYLDVLRLALAPGGHLMLATFGPDGPTQCSGLPVHRYDVATLTELLGAAFVLRDAVREDHVTPSGGHQQFQYGWWRRVDAP